jgi:hypothetical protein
MMETVLIVLGLGVIGCVISGVFITILFLMED